MPPGFSAYLDLLRLVAAGLVFLSHLGRPRFGGAAFSFPEHTGHSAVVIFFVLSGYVIDYVAHGRESEPRLFAASRFARLYSVAVPALLLTAFVDATLGGTSQGDLVSHYQYAKPWIYVPLFLAFGTDFWWLKEDAFSNLPYWSLSYEAWYYVMFGCLAFGRSRWRWVAAALAALLVGPRILLLLPLWLLGVGVARYHRVASLRRGTARSLFAASLALIVVILVTRCDLLADRWLADLIGVQATHALRYSQFVLGDLGLALLVAVNVLAARDAELDFGALSGPIRSAAASSFTLYLTHFPLLVFFTARLGAHPLITGAATLACIYPLSLLTERQKPRLRRLALAVLALPSGSATRP
jgi:peptidoglycan/LPS O-acetylase OafA/YrhL